MIFMILDGEEYLENGICIIEWGEIIDSCLPKNTIFINFENDKSDENTRKIIIS